MQRELAKNILDNIYIFSILIGITTCPIGINTSTNVDFTVMFAVVINETVMLNK